MPNSKTHSSAGALTCSIASIIYQKNFRPQQNINWMEVIFHGGVGAVAGVLPDILEPATNPNHREFFHSISFGLLILITSKNTIDKTKIEAMLKQNGISEGDKEFLNLLLLMLLLGMSSHLLLDSSTPKGLPFI